MAITCAPHHLHTIPDSSLLSHLTALRLKSEQYVQLAEVQLQTPKQRGVDVFQRVGKRYAFQACFWLIQNSGRASS